MVGIKNIGVYIPEGRRDNLSRLSEFDMDEHFVIEKLGIEKVSIKHEDEDTSDLCVHAFNDLEKRVGSELRNIEVLIVVTQNPDHSLPHTSAIIHKKLNLQTNCACFDISLGCSGYVYGLSVIKSFMEGNRIKNGVLLTSDPYSKVIDKNDKNTALLFGDAASATLMSEDAEFNIGQFTFGTIGDKYKSLIVENETLSMKGRSIFNFASVEIPKDIDVVLEKNQMIKDDIDRYILHPGSKYVVDSIASRAQIDPQKISSNISNYGNTVSSSIPILLSEEIESKAQSILMSGFGVGLSWSSVVIRRNK